MVRRTDPKDDAWENVKDAKKRKQIQDRLAQRARRQRLRQAKLNSMQDLEPEALLQTRTSFSSEDNSSPDNHPQTSNELVLSNTRTDTTVPPFLFIPSSDVRLAEPDGIGNSSETWDLDNINGLPANTENLQYTSDIYPGPAALLSALSQPNFPVTVFSALYINGEIQHIPCTTTYASRTPHPDPSIPLPLHPTELQRLVVHSRWIDRLPFPKMRDTLIKLQGVLDEEALIRDIFTLASWTIKPGQACWDPAAWVMDKEWEKKWGWLMI